MAAVIEHKSYARVGLLGNPNDFYFGNTISFSLGNFWAFVRLEPSIDLVIVPHPSHDLVQLNSISHLGNRLQNEGYYGGVRLLMAIVKIFHNHCKESNITLHDGNFTIITLRVSTVTQWHHISIQPTSSFGELKMILAMVTGLEPNEQRLLYKGKEREDCEYLHMVGVKDKDKVLLFQDPSIKERKLATNGHVQVIGSTYHTICV